MKPEDGYIAYIVNPKSGATSSKLLGRRFQKYLLKKGFYVKVSLTTSLENARVLLDRELLFAAMIDIKIK